MPYYAQFLEQQFAALVHGDDAKPGAGLLADHLPGNDVGVMFHRGDDDLIARAKPRAAEGVGDEVDRFSRPAGIDDLAVVLCVDELANFLARLFVEIGRDLAERVHAAVDVGVLRFVVALDGFENLAGFLRGRAVVEIDQGLPVGFSRQNREVGTDLGDVEGLHEDGR